MKDTVIVGTEVCVSLYLGERFGMGMVVPSVLIFLLKGQLLS